VGLRTRSSGRVRTSSSTWSSTSSNPDTGNASMPCFPSPPVHVPNLGWIRVSGDLLAELGWSAVVLRRAVKKTLGWPSDVAWMV
jgi:hypothetical protein